MELEIDKIGDVAAVAVPVDELDASNASERKRDMAPVLQANTKVELDLSRVRFMDSSGLARCFRACGSSAPGRAI